MFDLIRCGRLQALATEGGLNRRDRRLPLDRDSVPERKHPRAVIQLKTGDLVVVPYKKGFGYPVTPEPLIPDTRGGLMRLRMVAVMMTGLILLPAAKLSADEFKLTPSIAVRQEYNSNIFFDSKDEEDDFITRVRPGLELLNRSERLDLRLAGFVTPFFYWENDELNSIDQDYSGRLSYRPTPLLTLGADAGVRVDHQPDRDIGVTGIAYGDNRRIQQRYGGNLEYMFTERTSGSVSYAYTRDDWRKGMDSDLEDYDSHSVTLGLARELGVARGITVGLINAGWAHYEFESSETDYYFGAVGVRHRLTEIFNVTADVGVRYTDSRFDVARLTVVPPGVLAVVTDEQSDSGWGGIGHLGIEYTGERTRASLNASHDVNAASGARGVVQRTGLTLTGGYLLTEKLRLGLFAGVFKNDSDKNEFSGEKVDELAYLARPSLRWEIYREFTLEAGYNLSYLDDREADEASVQHVVYLQLAYGLPLFE